MLLAMPLKPRQFLQLVIDTAISGLEANPTVRMRGALAQLYFEVPHQHYEVWLRRQVGLLELGLHFEGPREENLRRLAAVADAMPEVLAGLGGNPEVEEWTESWTRVHEVCPCDALDEDFARRTGERLAAYVAVLEPIVRPLGPMPAPVRREYEPGRGRWDRRRRERRGTPGAGRPRPPRV
jgi:hypothetical protein